MFCEIGPGVACVADYPGHIAPKSQQEHRLGSPILSEQIVNQPFKFVQYSQIDFPVPADLKIRPNELSTTPDLAVLPVAARTEFSFTQNHESREASEAPDDKICQIRNLTELEGRKLKIRRKRAPSRNSGSTKI